MIAVIEKNLLNIGWSSWCSWKSWFWEGKYSWQVSFYNFFAIVNEGHLNPIDSLFF